MAWIEILDGPPEWAGVVFESEDDDAEFGLPHPRWVGTRWESGGERCMPTGKWRWLVTVTATATRDPTELDAADIATASWI